MVYHVKTEFISLGKRIARTVCVVACFLLSMFAVDYVWPSHGPKESNYGKWGFEVVVLGAITFLFDSVRREYDLEVGDEAIRMSGGTFGLHKGRVRRGHIRYFRESRGNMLREPGLWLSEHGRIGSFFSGYVWIPAALPEYEQIKAKAMTWLVMA